MRLLLKTIAIIFVVWSTNGYGVNYNANTPAVSVITPTNSQTPTWSWVRHNGSKGNETYRYKLNNGDLTSGATSTTNTNYKPGSPLSDGTHTLYVQEQYGDESAWSESGSAAVVIDSIAPIITSNSGGSIAAININENTTAVTSVVATEANTVTYSISGGADQAKFGISSGVLTFASAPNYESPTDDGTNNTYIVEVTATDDAGNVDTQTITVTVINVTESATLAISSIGNANVAEGSTYTSVTPSLTQQSDNPIGDLTYSLSGADATDFSINSSTGVVSMVARDYDNPVDSDSNNTYSLSIVATDEDSNSDTESWVVTVTDVDTQAPTATISPVNGTTDVANNANITLTFNEAIRYLDDSTIRDNNIGNNIITLKDTNASGTDIAFDATISGSVITINPDASFSSLQTVYVAISASVEDSSDNAISATSATFTAADSASNLPKFTETYPRVLQKNIGIDANIVLDFDQVVFASSNSAGGRNDRNVTIYNAATGLSVFSELSNSAYISGSGTMQITINPPNDLEERVDYYIFIGGDAFYDSDSNYYAGISDSNSLAFKTAKNPNKYANITASNETHVNHSMSQVEKSISAITNRQNFVRRNGGKNNSSQGIKFTFNNQALDDTLNKLAPLVSHFESYDISKQLANAADKALPNDWGLWTSGEIALGSVNTESGVDSTSKSKEISIGLDKVIDTDRMAGLSYRLNKTETLIGSDGTQMNSSTKNWSAYGSLKTNKHSTLEGLIGLGNISTDHTRVDGVNTYTGVRESQQAFICLIARESLHFKETNLSPFIRIDSSYTKQAAYSETGDSNTAYDALHYKSNNFHNTIFSVGVDTDVEYQFGDKTVKPYLSLRHKINTGYESSNEMYYLSNPVKEYTDVIASNSGESGFNLVIGADIQSAGGWLITSSYELSESELIHNKSLRFRAEWKF